MARDIAVVCSLFYMVTSASSVLAADASQGETLAKRWCANCHIVAADQQRGSTQAPPFSSIANKSDFNEAGLAFFLLAPHPVMPDMNLSRREAADLAAYIKTQRQR
jgi:mono/diheme cytochrome c family protein